MKAFLLIASIHCSEAWIAEQVPQCGYCQSGQIMRAAALLLHNKSLTRDQIVEEMRANICRCGTYVRILRAIERAARDKPSSGVMDKVVTLESPATFAR